MCAGLFLGKWAEDQVRVSTLKWFHTVLALLSSYEGLEVLTIGPMSCCLPPLCQGRDSLLAGQLVVS